MKQRCGRGKDGADPHRPQVGGKACAASAVRVARRIPLKKPRVGDQHPHGCTHDGVQAEEGLVGQTREAKGRCSGVPADRARHTGEMLTDQYSPGFRKSVRREEIQGGTRRVPSPARVQSQGGDKSVQPSSNKSVNVAGTRLRRRLSKIFQRESRERILSAARRSVQEQGHSVASSARSANPRESSGGDGSRPRRSARKLLVELHISQQPRPRIASFHEVVTQDPVLGKRPLSACSNASTS